MVGKATIVLEEVITKERGTYTLSTGDRLFVPKEVALRISAEMDREGKTHKYVVD
ncbi:MAG: hypothetical protein AABX53_02780 [Nanoarchaeota archaeon]